MTHPVPDVVAPRQTPAEIAAKARAHLEAVVRIDSSSDARSESIPSTPGQVELAAWLEAFFTARGASVERDAYANTIATLPGRGALAQAPPLALLIHLDTAQGTHAVDGLEVCQAWDGRARIPYPNNASLQVTVDNYPALARFVGHDLVHGPGDAPFGLDDKLGLTHMMTLAWLLEAHPEAAHPPLLLIARPDEEIGRMEALEGLAVLLAERGVRRGYTLDGIEPFEVNVENFNAAQVSVRFPHRPLDRGELEGGVLWGLELRGVNTHGATAHAERHRPATRLAVELLALLEARGVSERVEVLDMACDVERDCDARVVIWSADATTTEALRDAIATVIAPFEPLGAGWSIERIDASEEVLPSAAAQDALGLVGRFLASEPGFVLSAEDSYGRMGYSQPYRIIPDGDGLRLDIRLRDFDPEGLDARRTHALRIAADLGFDAAAHAQYVNMGPRIEGDAALIGWPQAAAASLGFEAPVLPIRGGTGVDPFLDQGIAIANLGTGYFAPESEKEFTSLQLMADHARWLFALVQRIDGRAA